MLPSAIYLDHAATTPVRPEVREAMLPYLTEAAFGNPSSPHRFGRAARAGLEQARREVADALGAEPDQVVFTSGGTEADNLAVIGACLAARAAGRPPRAVVTALEHKAVLAAAHAVCGLGGEEAILPVDGHGVVSLDALDRALESRPAIVSVMWVNNETGVLQPIGEVASRCEAAGVLFHSDAVQALGKTPIDLRALPCPLLTVSGHKVGAPKGIGALILRGADSIAPLIHGGGQQHGIRPGTENIAGAVGLGRAARLAADEQAHEAVRLGGLRDDLSERLRAALPDVVVHGEAAPRAPHILSVAVPGVDSEAMLMHLDLAGVAVSSGSACMTGAVEPSHVLTAMGVPRDLAVATIRFSLGRTTTADEVRQAAAVFPEVVTRVRRLAGVLGRA
jgi:cysteine desulfurase